MHIFNSLMLMLNTMVRAAAIKGCYSQGACEQMNILLPGMFLADHLHCHAHHLSFHLHLTCLGTGASASPTWKHTIKVQQPVRMELILQR